MNFLKNLSSLFFLQIANQIIPMALIPFLSYKMGIEVYGYYALAYGIIVFGSVIVDYGFSIWGIAQVAKNRDDKSLINNLYSKVTFAKLILFLIFLVFYVLVILFWGKIEYFRLEFSIVLFALFSMVFHNFWILNGLEKNYIAASLHFFSKFFWILGVFLFVNGPKDLIWAISSVVFYNIVFSLSVSFYIYKQGVRFVSFHFSDLLFILREASGFFLSRLAASSYIQGGVLLVGYFSTAQGVALYSIAEQMYRGAQSLISPISQVMYPYMVRTKDVAFFFKILFASILLAIFGCLFAFFFGEYFIIKIFGQEFLAAKNILDVFLISIIITTPSILFGYPWMGAFGMLEKANVSVYCGGLAQIFIISITILFFNVNPTSMAVSLLLCEIVVLALRIYWGRVLDFGFIYK